MPKRARYDGGHPAVIVEVLPGKTVTVEQGHQLPTELDGEQVPASVRDGLLETNDWSEVDAPAPTPKKREES